VIHVQGCSLGCPSCFNPATHPFDAGEEISPEELAGRIVRESPAETSGVSLSGGEPVSQAVSVYHFLTMLHALRPDFTVGLYTGHTIGQLVNGTYDLREHLPMDTPGIRARLWTDQIWPHLDFLVEGPYDRTRLMSTINQTRADARCSLLASANQGLLVNHRSRYSYQDFNGPRMVEIQINPGGSGTVSGFPMKPCQRIGG
jgi:organic radical activating enzyme